MAINGRFLAKCRRFEMSCRKHGHAGLGKGSFHLLCTCRRRRDDAQGGARPNAALAGRCSFVFRVVCFTALCALAFICCGVEISPAQETDFSVHARAVEFCRGNVMRPMALDLDKRVLCFDGEISSQSNLSRAWALEFNGLFVVRSYGGEGSTAMALANLIRDRRATVVVYDYCLSACASFLLVASDEAFVMKDTIVAWHDIVWPLCPVLEAPKDDGPKRLEKSICSDTPAEHQSKYAELKSMIEEFYATRIVDPLFQHPPESFTIRRLLRSKFEGTGNYPDVAWTWNPRYYAGTFKTKIIYEAYPGSQDEIDALASKFHFPNRILYDP
jgi:hypothetical protein